MLNRKNEIKNFEENKKKMKINPTLEKGTEWYINRIKELAKQPKIKTVIGFVNAADDDGYFLVDKNDKIIESIEDYYGAKIKLTIELIE